MAGREGSPKTPQRPVPGYRPQMANAPLTYYNSVNSTVSSSSSGVAEVPATPNYQPSTKKKTTSMSAMKNLRNKVSNKLGKQDEGRRVTAHKRAPSEISSIIGSSRQGGNRNINQQVALFEKGQFDLEGDLQGLTEKGIDTLRVDLAAIDIECSEEVKKTIHDHYRQFILASQGISKLEGEMQQLRNILNNTTELLDSLKEVASTSTAATRLFQNETDEDDLQRKEEWRESSKGVQWADLIEEIDVTIAERKTLEALRSLRKAEQQLQRDDKEQPGPIDYQSRAESMAGELDARRERLVGILESQIAEGGTSQPELRLAAGVLGSVAGKAHAHRLLLDSHSARLKRQQQQLLKPQNTGGGDADGTEYAGALSQKVFRAIATAADDVAAVFGDETPELSALFLVWALQETERCALLLKRHALTPFAAPAGLTAVVHCVLLALIHCQALEETHGLKLSPRLARELWGPTEQVLQRRLRRVGEDVKRVVTAEIDAVARGGVASSTKTGWERLMDIFPSADFLLDEVQAVIADLLPLAGPRVAIAVRKGVSDVFQVYTSTIAQAFGNYRVPDGSLPALIDTAVEPAMEACASLVEQFLPEVTQPLSDKVGSICDQQHLMSILDALGQAMGFEVRE